MRLRGAACGVAGLLVALAATAAPTPDERRIERVAPRHALCIGQDAYRGFPALRNAGRDARALAATLEGLGFAVEAATDLDGVGLENALRRFVARLTPGDVAFFFYAGHGLQIEGENYLLPVDFDARTEVEARHKGYKADLLREAMEASGARVNIIVLDSCRDNPFKATRSGARGLARMEAGRGTLVVLATGPGQTASDSPGAANGLFTTHLLRELSVPGRRVQEVFERTREAVDEASGHRQRPWVHSDVIGDVYLVPPPAATEAALAPRPAAATDATLELAFWNSVATSQDPRDFEEYLRRHPQGTFAGLARNRLERLRTPPATPAPATPAPQPSAVRALGGSRVTNLAALHRAAVCLGWLEQAPQLGLFEGGYVGYAQCFVGSAGAGLDPLPPELRTPPTVHEAESTYERFLAYAEGAARRGDARSRIAPDVVRAGWHAGRAHIHVQYARCHTCVQEHLRAAGEALLRAGTAAASPRLAERGRVLADAARDLGPGPRGGAQPYGPEWGLLYDNIEHIADTLP